VAKTVVSEASPGAGPGDLEVVPALFEHACSVYKAMEESSEMDDTLGLRVYEGHLTNLFKKLLLSVPYYTEIKNRLISIGCIEQVRRGGGTAMSRWVLWKEPTLEEWKYASSKRPGRGNTITVLQQQIKDLIIMNRKLRDDLEHLTYRVGHLEDQNA
jgi:hypothetical protein